MLISDLFQKSGLCLLLLVSLGTSFLVAEEVPEDIVFQADYDGSEERYVLLRPEGVSSLAGRSLLVALHGHGSDRWQFIVQSRGECSAVREMAAAYGLPLISPDYRASTSWMGPAAEADLQQILREWKERYNPPKIILAGGSMGAAAALTFAALNPDLVDGVLAMNGIANHVLYEGFQEAIAASFGGGKEAVPEEYIRRSAELQVEALTMPVALTLGARDEVTPPDSVLRLADALRARGRSVFVLLRPGGGHETSHGDGVEALEWLFSAAFLPEKSP
ncbi:MAG: alpha/beta fold hydrolase [Candidatus Hydrogenedens sp.]|nr:alpha/beta fold hydrolase [Candidatus Hydrogenedens sp.]